MEMKGPVGAESGWYREAKLSPLEGKRAFVYPAACLVMMRGNRKGGGQVESDLGDLIVHRPYVIGKIVRKLFTKTTAPCLR